MLDRADGLCREQLGKQAHHHLAVLEHVRDARRHAQVVLEHEVFALARTHHVDPGDVRVDSARNIHALHLAPILRVAEHALFGDHAGLENGMLVIDVMQEQVERTHALLEPSLERAPLASRNDAGHDVEGDKSLGAAVLAVYGKGDADTVKSALGFIAFLRNFCRGGAV